MMRWLPYWIAGLWWASLAVIGMLVVPMLFVHLPSPALAGRMAAQLFSVQCWVSALCAIVLLLISRPSRSQTLYPWAKAAIGFIVTGLLLALLLQFGVAPKIVARQDLRFWHAVGSVIYLLQCICAAFVFSRVLSHGSNKQPSEAL